MRTLFLLALLANFALYAYGTGAFGIPPQERGREPERLTRQTAPETLQVTLSLPRRSESAAPASSSSAGARTE